MSRKPPQCSAKKTVFLRLSLLTSHAKHNHPERLVRLASGLLVDIQWPTTYTVNRYADSAVKPDLSVASNTVPASSTQPRESIWSDDCAFDTMRRLIESNGVIFCPNRCDQKLLSGILLAAAHFKYVDMKGDKGFWRCTDYQYGSLRGMVVEICAIYAKMDEKDLVSFSSWPQVEAYYNRWFRNCLRERTHDRLPEKTGALVHQRMFGPQDPW